MITVKISKSWINMCTLKTIFIICKNDIFALIRKISIRNGLKKPSIIVEGMSWNKVHKICIVEELVSRTINLRI